MTRLFGRALAGERAHGSRPKNRGKNITMISVICLEQVLATMTYEGGIKRQRHWRVATAINSVIFTDRKLSRQLAIDRQIYSWMSV
ncbi:hypothetical protein HCU40_20115 (plasmid) [Pseudanabaena biceps]|nr:hypothetical protein [Pseudanabaena biceps]